MVVRMNIFYLVHVVSTLKAIFEGRRELFRGLAIERMDYDWRKYPILHLDFSNMALGEPQNLRDFLEAALLKWAGIYQIELRGAGLSLQFENLIEDIAAALQRFQGVRHVGRGLPTAYANSSEPY